MVMASRENRIEGRIFVDGFFQRVVSQYARIARNEKGIYSTVLSVPRTTIVAKFENVDEGGI
jgi:hypothetical protein